MEELTVLLHDERDRHRQPQPDGVAPIDSGDGKVIVREVLVLLHWVIDALQELRAPKCTTVNITTVVSLPWAASPVTWSPRSSAKMLVITL